MLLRQLGLWRDMQFATFDHYNLLCRSRHKAHYADRRIMPRRLSKPLSCSKMSAMDAA
jgi:hypothetical protein